MHSTIRWSTRLGLVAAVLAVQTVAASAQSVSPAPASAPGAQCLTPQQKETNAKLKALKRPTTREDPVWVFDPEYFVGNWELEWGGPDTLLTTEVTGMLTIRHVEGCFYEGVLKGKDHDGAFTTKVQILSNPDKGWVTWVETDSRGFTIVRSGMIGSDLGGYFTHFWDHAPMFEYKGQKARLYGSTFLSSPAAFILRQQLSVDGGSYLDLGSLWFRKQDGGVSSAERR